MRNKFDIYVFIILDSLFVLLWITLLTYKGKEYNNNNEKKQRNKKRNKLDVSERHECPRREY